jgi:hypothetical protein
LAIIVSISDLEAQLEAIDAQIVELLSVPLDGTVGRTRISLAKNITELRTQRGLIISQIRAAKIRQGTLRPADREVF